MPFTDEEAQSLLAVKGIGKTVLQRGQNSVFRRPERYEVV